jgi:hypothetical protein
VGQLFAACLRRRRCMRALSLRVRLLVGSMARRCERNMVQFKWTTSQAAREGDGDDGG